MSSSFRYFFKVAKQIVRKNKDVVGVTCIKDKMGRLTKEMAQIKLAWKEYFEELLNEEFDWQKENLEKVSGVSGECMEITFEEVKVAMKAEDMQRLERTERMMIRWMCGVRLRIDVCDAIHVVRHAVVIAAGQDECIMDVRY